MPDDSPGGWVPPRHLSPRTTAGGLTPEPITPPPGMAPFTPPPRPWPTATRADQSPTGTTRSASSLVRHLVALGRPGTWHRPARRGSGPVRSVRLLVARHRRALTVAAGLFALFVTVRSAAPPPDSTVPVLVAAHDLAAGQVLGSDALTTVGWPVTAAPAGLLTSGSGRVLAAAMRRGEPLTDARVIGPGLLTGLPAGSVAIAVRPGDASAGALVRPGDRVDVFRASAATDWTAAQIDVQAPSVTRAAADSAARSVPGEPAVTATPSAVAATSVATQPIGSGGPVAPAGPVGDSAAGVARIVCDALVLAVPGNGSAEGGPDSASALDSLTGGAGRDRADATGGVVMLAVTRVEAERLTAAQAGDFIAIAVLQRP